MMRILYITCSSLDEIGLPDDHCAGCLNEKSEGYISECEEYAPRSVVLDYGFKDIELDSCCECLEMLGLNPDIDKLGEPKVPVDLWYTLVELYFEHCEDYAEFIE